IALLNLAGIKTSAIPRIKYSGPQQVEEIGASTPCRRGSTSRIPPDDRPLDMTPSLIARDSHPVVDGAPRTHCYPGDLAGVISVKEPQNQDAARLGSLLTAARVVANLSQDLSGVDQGIDVDRPQEDFGRFIVEKVNYMLLDSNRSPDSRHVDISQHPVQVAFHVLNGTQIRRGQCELYKSIMNQVFGFFTVMPCQLHGPVQQPVVTLDDDILMGVNL